MKTKTNRRPVVFQGVTYPEYEIDFYTSNVYGKMFKDKDRALKHYKQKDGYCSITLQQKPARVHVLIAETFHDLLPKSPLVSHYGLQMGRDRHELKTPTGFTFICNMVCPDHIDGNPSNNHHSNLMIVTQLENNMKRGPHKRECASSYKGVTNDRGKFKARIVTRATIDQNGKAFALSKNNKTEEEAALRYNKILEESLFTIWGEALGPKLYDFAYKNVIEK